MNENKAEISQARLDWKSENVDTLALGSLLNWALLASGELFSRFEDQFKNDGRADQLLLENLRFIRNHLLSHNLSKQIAHDLLGRVIFIQFLSHRKDKNGNEALDEPFLERLFKMGVLSSRYRTVIEVLRAYDDGYALFRWLNEKFNGDLFPGKAADSAKRELEWREEMAQVSAGHLRALADFIAGDMVMAGGQRCLFPIYSFDAIPLELISSIYEEFVSQDEDEDSVAAHYTPPHLVDFVLDAVLPWEGKTWDLKILDPSCGSGIFLVKAYQRLIHRWKTCNGSGEISPTVLRSLLEKNLFGVDSNPLAVRVASFSLYLAMCDEVDPKHYWTKVKFPPVRNRTIHEGDLFNSGGRQLAATTPKADVVIGNAPWGRGTVTPEALKWAKKNDWAVAYKSIGPLFLPKAAEYSRSGASIAMLQPSGLIMNRIKPAADFRKKLFTTFEVNQVTNLSALRFGLFENAVAPACVVALKVRAPENRPVLYVCPKPAKNALDGYEISIDRYDLQPISVEEAATDPWVWTVLTWGSRRDYALIKRLGANPTLQRFSDQHTMAKRQGVIRGDRKRTNQSLNGRRFIQELPTGTFLRLRLVDLPTNTDLQTHSRDSQDLSAFELPQLILKQGWEKANSRFQAALIEGDSGPGALCSKSYVSVHVPPELKSLLMASCLFTNSLFAVYFFLLTSARFAAYRPEVNVEDLLRLPLINVDESVLSQVETPAQIDSKVFDLLGLKQSERALIEDAVQVTLQDFKGGATSIGRTATSRSWQGDSSGSQLHTYCEWFIRVMRAGFGADKNVSATIFEEFGPFPLPFRMVAFDLGKPLQNNIKIESFDAPFGWRGLIEGLLPSRSGQKVPFTFRRTARIYQVRSSAGGETPTVVVIKPDQMRYWTRTMALRDADEVALDILDAAAVRHYSQIHAQTPA
ncbi:MAG: N-6 DNA methylase [Candidatus Sulfotelmatobacter sp.]